MTRVWGAAKSEELLLVVGDAALEIVEGIRTPEARANLDRPAAEVAGTLDLLVEIGDVGVVAGGLHDLRDVRPDDRARELRGNLGAGVRRGRGHPGRAQVRVDQVAGT